MLNACANTPGREPLTRQLPDAPTSFKPEVVPAPKAGESAIVVIARERRARKRANKTIENFGAFYSGVQHSYGPQ